MNKILLTLLCAVPFLAFSQSNYKTGAVTANDGSVLTGYIDYREWVQNPRIIQFKLNLSDPNPRNYVASDLKGYMINGMENYITYNGRISMNATRFPDLPTGVDTSSNQAIVFLKQLVKGEYMNLYVYTDSLKTRYFAQEQQEQPVELLYQNYFNNDTHGQIKTVKSYTGYLIFLAGKYRNNDASLISSIQHSEYNSDIIKLVDKINSGKIASSKSYSNLSGIRYYVGAAFNQNRFTFHIPNTGDAILNKLVPALNFGVDILPNKNVQKIFIRADLTLSYNKLQYQRNFDSFFVVNGVPYYTGNFSYVYTANLFSAAIAPQVGLNLYNTDGFKFYVAAGAAITMIQYGNQKLLRTKQGESNTTLLTSYDFGSPRLGFPVQVGVTFNKQYEIYTSYQHNGSFKLTSDRNYNLGYNTIAVGFHWLLR